MATNKVVKVTVASVVTNDALSGYNFYSNQDGKLNTSVVTPANAANGVEYALTDGLVHQITAKPVGASNGEFAAVVSNSVQVDLAAATKYAIQTNSTDQSHAHTLGHFIPSTGDWAVGLVVEDFVAISGGHLIGVYGRDHIESDGLRINAFTTVDLAGNGSASIDLKYWDGTTGQTSANNVSISVGDYVELRRAGDEVSIWVNGVKTSVTANLATSYAFGASRTISVAASKITQRNTSVKFSRFTFLGDDIIPAGGTTQSTGDTISGATYSLTLLPGSGPGVDSMYTAI